MPLIRLCPDKILSKKQIVLKRQAQEAAKSELLKHERIKEARVHQKIAGWLSELDKDGRESVYRVVLAMEILNKNIQDTKLKALAMKAIDKTEGRARHLQAIEKLAFQTRKIKCYLPDGYTKSAKVKPCTRKEAHRCALSLANDQHFENEVKFVMDPAWEDMDEENELNPANTSLHIAQLPKIVIVEPSASGLQYIPLKLVKAVANINKNDLRRKSSRGRSRTPLSQKMDQRNKHNKRAHSKMHSF